ncbi:hypothetical protein VP01_709g3 [Puccinia sorghi]|uniref:Uncharacterized protein n=1 Tax=Puccinia sorghi TaxID=27349 RepID=A0A0L6UFR5_9BASI|nr:hypothetical protein VP01_709g3 [Puccinia sorghi]
MMIHLATIGGGATDPKSLNLFKELLCATRLTTNQSLQENSYKCVSNSFTYAALIAHVHCDPLRLVIFLFARNYGEFVAMSKDIATLENEILELKCVLEEFKTPPNDLNMGLGMTTKSSLSEGGKEFHCGCQWTLLELPWETVEAQPDLTYQRPSKPSISFYSTTVFAIQKRSHSATAKAKLMAEKCFNLAQILIISPMHSRFNTIRKRLFCTLMNHGGNGAQETQAKCHGFWIPHFAASVFPMIHPSKIDSSALFHCIYIGIQTSILSQSVIILTRIRECRHPASIRQVARLETSWMRCQAGASEWSADEPKVGKVVGQLEGQIEVRAQELADRLLSESAEKSVKKAHELVRTVALLGRLAGPFAPVDRAMQSEHFRRQIGRIKFEDKKIKREKRITRKKNKNNEKRKIKNKTRKKKKIDFIDPVRGCVDKVESTQSGNESTKMCRPPPGVGSNTFKIMLTPGGATSTLLEIQSAYCDIESTTANTISQERCRGKTGSRSIAKRGSGFGQWGDLRLKVVAGAMESEGKCNLRTPLPVVLDSGQDLQPTQTPLFLLPN